MYYSVTLLVLLLISINLAASARIPYSIRDDGDDDDDDSCKASDQRAGHAEFSYEDSDTYGPKNWDSLTFSDGEVNECGGDLQSPINIETSKTCGTLQKPIINMKKSNFEFKADHHNFKFVCTKNCGSITLNGITYDFKQVHFHRKSEHKINGDYSDMEGHFVHSYTDSTTNTTSLAVLAVFIEADDEVYNSGFGKLMTAASKMGSASSVPLKSLFQKSAAVLATKGSLTTPPCTEGVQWLFSMGKIRIGEDQAEDFYCKLGQSNNNRPIQSTGTRCLYKTA